MNNANVEADINNDGIVDEKEIRLYEMRATNRRRMAWVSLVAMVVSAILIMFFVPDSRLDKIKDMLDLYWIALGGVVGAYVGISAWTKRG